MIVYFSVSHSLLYNIYLCACTYRSHFLHIWTLESKTLLRIIDLPTKVRMVKQLEFLNDSFDGGSSQTVGILSQDGIIRFVNIHTCKLVFEVGSHEKVLYSVESYLLSLIPSSTYDIVTYCCIFVCVKPVLHCCKLQELCLI